jgi:alpha-tubulin suppressor-like RCC1 family protein
LRGPVTVTGSTQVVGFGGGFGHTCATLENGAVKCWGYNEFGQLGDGTNDNQHEPVDVLF